MFHCAPPPSPPALCCPCMRSPTQPTDAPCPVHCFFLAAQCPPSLHASPCLPWAVQQLHPCRHSTHRPAGSGSCNLKLFQHTGQCQETLVHDRQVLVAKGFATAANEMPNMGVGGGDEQGIHVFYCTAAATHGRRVATRGAERRHAAPRAAHLYRLYRGLYIQLYALSSRSCGFGSSVATPLW